LLKRYASRVGLACDADAAGQGAAERFYEWEEKYQVEVRVAGFPGGKDPGEIAQEDPSGLTKAVDEARPFLGFRLERVLGGRRPDSPEGVARLGEAAMAVVNEHPNVNIRKLYAGEVATRVGLPVNDLVSMAERGQRRPSVTVRPAQRRPERRQNAEFAVLSLLVQDWDSIAPWLVESLFSDDVYRRAFLAIADAGGDLTAALAAADPESRDVIERAAVVDLSVDPGLEARNLVGAAVRRELNVRVRNADSGRIRADAEARVRMEELVDPDRAVSAMGWLLGWLEERRTEHGEGA
ncbi:MAG: toprim domain-containing protein, partial [Ilumatobacteraceae bacterium]